MTVNFKKLELCASEIITGIRITYIHGDIWTIFALTFGLKPGKILAEGKTLEEALERWSNGNEESV